MKNLEKVAQPAKINEKILFLDIRNRCLAWSKIVGHSHKTTNPRAAKTAKLNVACPKTLG